MFNFLICFGFKMVILMFNFFNFCVVFVKLDGVILVVIFEVKLCVKKIFCLMFCSNLWVLIVWFKLLILIV